MEAKERTEKNDGRPEWSEDRLEGLIEKLTWLLEGSFRIPGTDIRFGLDPLLGLVPWIGDTISLVMSAVLIFSMGRSGATYSELMKMTARVLFDYLLGSIPVVGDIFDFFYRANSRNLQAFKNRSRHSDVKPKRPESGSSSFAGKSFTMAGITVFVAIIVLVLYGSFQLFAYLFSIL